MTPGDDAMKACAARGHYDWERVGTMHTRDEEHHIYWCPGCGAVENHIRPTPASAPDEVLVPRKATEAMWRAGQREAHTGNGVDAIYRAMIAAALKE